MTHARDPLPYESCPRVAFPGQTSARTGDHCPSIAARPNGAARAQAARGEQPPKVLKKVGNTSPGEVPSGRSTAQTLPGGVLDDNDQRGIRFCASCPARCKPIRSLVSCIAISADCTLSFGTCTRREPSHAVDRAAATLGRGGSTASRAPFDFSASFPASASANITADGGFRLSTIEVGMSIVAPLVS